MKRSRSASPLSQASPSAINSSLKPDLARIPAQTARIEIHSFESVTLTDKQFLTGAKDGIPARIGGELRLPPGTARVPAVILVSSTPIERSSCYRSTRESTPPVSC